MIYKKTKIITGFQHISFNFLHLIVLFPSDSSVSLLRFFHKLVPFIKFSINLLLSLVLLQLTSDVFRCSMCFWIVEPAAAHFIQIISLQTGRRRLSNTESYQRFHRSLLKIASRGRFAAARLLR